MILIADSGSTKTSWCLSGYNKLPEYISTGGLNPFFRTSEEIEAELREKLLPGIHSPVQTIYFYGAGVINQEKGNIVKSALKKLFLQAKIEVESDLLASARATLGKDKGIACILGTGSNSCLYNGDNITEHVPPLGYILGDEGSGAVIGRKLIGDYLKGIMPENLTIKFNQQFPFSYAELMDGVYKLEKPSKFLAQFAPFLKAHIAEEYCKNSIENSFKEFVIRNVSRYSNFKELPVSFVGSVAFHFKEQLENVLKRYNLQIGMVLKDPLNGLLEFHTNK